jgi:hypothetical protein
MDNREYKQKFEAIQKEMLDLTMSKHSDYGDDSVFEMGMKMRFADIHRKYQRLKALMWYDRVIEVDSETLKDTLLDLANYAVIAIIQMGEDND